MRLHSLFARRPTPSLIISALALFVSLGGVGYAATQIPNNSVGTSQLRNNAVTNSKLSALSVGFGKIQLGAVGIQRINTGQVQARVKGTCAANSAIASIDNKGSARCTPTAPNEFGTSTASAVTVPSGATPTSITTESLSGGSSYLVFANPYVQITASPPTQAVEVDCTLAVGPTATATQTRSYAVELGTDDQASSIPLVVTAPSSPNAITATVSCSKKFSGATEPKVTVSTAINAIQTASNS